MKLKIAMAAAFVAIGMTGQAIAKDWIEAVSVTKDGIDLQAVEVRANSTGYTSIKTQSHTFALLLYAKATNGERIVAAALSSMSGVEYFEWAGNTVWRVEFTGREVGAGSLRTWTKPYDAVVPMAKVNWHGRSAVEACRDLLQAKTAQGMSRSAVLSKSWDVNANVYFQLQALAAKKRKAQNQSWGIGSVAGQRSSVVYPVRVRCLAAARKVG